MEDNNNTVVLKKDYKCAIHKTKYGRGSTYTLYIGLNPFGPRGGTSGTVVDANYSYDFHCRETTSYRVLSFINKIFNTMKKLDIPSIPINIDEYAAIFKSSKYLSKMDDLILDELLKHDENLYKIFLSKQKEKI